jgi:hypothetical protein
VYVLANEQNISIAEAWDGTHLKITFRRCFDHDLMLNCSNCSNFAVKWGTRYLDLEI